MFPHHRESIDNVTGLLSQRDEILAILVSGSVAHNFAREDSDVDLMIIVTEEEYHKRKASGDLHYYDSESATYKDGYIDGKFISTAFMEAVAQKGTEPARFAFEGTFASYSKMDGLASLLRKITRYPVERKSENISRFHAQFEAWHWYCGEAIKHGNKYLLTQSVSKLILFGGRMLLAHNEQLYPYHKWFLTVLERCTNRPEEIIRQIGELLDRPERETINTFHETILHYRDWEIPGKSWPNIFMRDSELGWLDGPVDIADV